MCGWDEFVSIGLQVVSFARPVASLARPVASLARPVVSLARPVVFDARPMVSIRRRVVFTVHEDVAEIVSLRTGAIEAVGGVQNRRFERFLDVLGTHELSSASRACPERSRRVRHFKPALTRWLIFACLAPSRRFTV